MIVAHRAVRPAFFTARRRFRVTAAFLPAATILGDVVLGDCFIQAQ